MITLRIEFALAGRGVTRGAEQCENRCINKGKKIEQKENRQRSKGKAEEDAKDVDRRKRRWNVLAGRPGKGGGGKMSQYETHTQTHMCECVCVKSFKKAISDST